MSFYVYRFKDINEQIVYVGKTKSLKSRMKQHFSNHGHLNKNQYDQVKTVEFIELSTKIDMDIKELYYINKWQPDFNFIDKNHPRCDLDIEEDLNWLVYTDDKEKEDKNMVFKLINEETLRNTNISINLKQILKEKNISQKDFSEMSGLREATVSQMVNNKYDRIQLENLIKVMLTLNISDFNDIFSFNTY